MATAPIEYSSRVPTQARRNEYRSSSYPHHAADEPSSCNPHTGAADAEILSRSLLSGRQPRMTPSMLTPTPSPRYASSSPRSAPASPGTNSSPRPTTPASISIQKSGGAVRGPTQYTPTPPSSSRRALTDSEALYRYGQPEPELHRHRDHTHAHSFPSESALATVRADIAPAETTASTLGAMNATTTTTSMPTQPQTIAADESDFRLNNNDMFSRSRSAEGKGQPRGSHGLEQNSNLNNTRPMQNQSIDERGQRSHSFSNPSPKHARAHKSKASSPTEGGTAISVDMKRLLSKPAPPSSGTRSLPGSDSEFSSPHRSRAVSSSKSEGADERRSRSHTQVPQLPQLPFQHHSTSFSSASPVATPSSNPTTTPSSSNEDARSQTSTQKNTRRNVLKRKPSAPKMPSNTSLNPSSMSRHASSTLRIDSDLSRGIRRTTTPLTPAGAVAEAYKQQEQRRASAQGSDDLATPRVSDQHFDTDRQAVGKSQPPSPTPYYTVIGTSSGRLVAVGGPSDRWLDGFSGPSRLKLDSEPKAASPNHVRSISRKLSARWKRSASGLKVEKAQPDSENSSALSGSSKRDQDSVEEPAGRRSVSLPRERIKSSGNAMREDVKVHDARSYGRSMASMQGASTSAWVTVGVPDGQDENGKARGDRSPTKAREEGGKIWKLMKRISTGGLRDKYHLEKDAPPVPSLPKDVMHRSWTRGSGSGNSADSPTTSLSRFISRSSLSTPIQVAPSMSPRASTSTTAHKAVSAPRRPSMATGSSSPVSSDVASSRFFHRTHSARSSTSSLGEIIPPPLPSTMTLKNIISPSELNRVTDLDNAKVVADSSRKGPHRSTTMPENDVLPPPGYSPDDSRLGRLPLPPRRATTSGQQVTYQSNPHFKSQPSPDIPLFSNLGAINTFPPPALPIRSAKRLANSISASQAGSDLTSTSATTDSSRKSHDVKHVQDNSKAGRPLLHRRSSEVVNTISTENVEITSHFNTISSRAPASKSETHSSSAKRAPVNFREAETTPKPPLTAEEKAEIWDTLLERSDRAGGTLRLGGQELFSDRMKMESSLSLYSDSLLTD